MAQDYKETMNLPQTDFPMRAGLPVNEPKRLEKWAEMDLYHKILEQNRGNERWVLHDGPPYANGPIHIGHAFNKTLKDIIVKYKSQRGYFSPYVPGWDCHGQPIEHMVETKLGPAKMAAIDQPTLRRLCREWARENIDLQREGFKRLGVLGEWDDPYLTYTPAYEAGNVRIFKTLYEAGAIYRGRKPIHWCRHCHTALAEAEIEYGDESSPSIYVALSFTEKVAPFADAAAPPAPGTDTPFSLLIWTTTPWTLPANTAVSLAPDASYVAVLHGGTALVMARELVAQVGAAAGWETPDFVRTPDGEVLAVKGSALAGLHYAHPIHPGMTGMVVTGEHVTLDTGTGAVHTAPGHGQDDYLVGERYDLPMLMPVDDNGVFDAGGGPFEGMDVDEANPVIIDWLRERGTLVARVDITHSYPHCWRCHNPVIFRATDQWFVSMDATGLRERALGELEKLNWYPQWASKRLYSMVEGRPDWCISRQRSWGVPIPVFKCVRCSATVATSETFDAVIALFEREGADAWFTREPAEYLPARTCCEHCGSTELLPERDILDVWWESGVSHTSVLDSYEDLARPAELYLEGSDQHRGWFQSSLLTSVGAYGVAPFRGIMSCGFTVDENGEKMSKSKGNGIDPADVIREYGADVLRLWVGSVDSAQDVGIGKNILDRTADAYRRFRNTFRFLLSNLYDFDGSPDTVSWEQLPVLDRWALARLQQLMHTVDEAYEGFRFHQVFHAIYDYVVSDLSAVYLDTLKDRLYSDAPKSMARRSAQTVLAHVLEVLVRQLAPLLTFTCDEVWEYYPEGLRDQGADGQSRAVAVQLAGWPSVSDFTPVPPAGEAERLLEDFVVVLAVRDAVTKALEEARNAKVIGKSQEAEVILTVAPSVAAVLKGLPAGTLEELFIVAVVSVVTRGEAGELEGVAREGAGVGVAARDGAGESEVAVRDGAGEPDATTPEVIVSRTAGEKCPRCWNIRELGVDAAHPAVCGRCAAVLTELGFVEPGLAEQAPAKQTLAEQAPS